MKDLEATFDEEAAELALAAAMDLRSALAGHIKGADRKLVNAIAK
jgi:hypothetical protein